MPAAARPMRTFVIESGHLRAEVLEFGATLIGVWFGDSENLVLRLDELDDYRDPARNPYLGSMVGRYANRIAGSVFEIDGERHQLVPNDGPNSLHGGPEGWSFRDWRKVGSSTESSDSVTLSLVTLDGDMGFPGDVATSVTYSVRDDALHIEATAMAASVLPTVISMTNHAYWNLDGGNDRPGRAGTDIDGLALSLMSDRYLEVDDTMIPTGREIAIEPMADASIGSWDHWFPIAGAGGTSGTSGAADTLRAAAELSSRASGLRMLVDTTAPGVQVYTANMLGAPFGPRRGICLEACTAPDTAKRCIVPAGGRYQWSVVHRFSRLQG